MASKLVQAWSRFWFEAPDHVWKCQVFRRLLGCVLLGLYSLRSLDLKTYYGEAGVFPRELSGEFLAAGYRWTIFHVLTGDTWLVALNSLFLLSLASMAVGKFSRIASVIAFILHISFLHRNVAIVYGVDMISTFFIFFCIFIPVSGTRPSSRMGEFGSVAYRLLQIQLCVIYFYSGLEKVRGSNWWRGDALWYVLTNDQISRWDWSWAADYPAFFVAIAYSTVLWEIYFPALVWIKRFRPWMLGFGILLHGGIAVLLGIQYFSAIMVTVYVLFVDREDLKEVNQRLSIIRRTLF